MKKTASELFKSIKEEFPEPLDQVLVIHFMNTEVPDTVVHPNKIKEIGEGVACKVIGLTWNCTTMHGKDAQDSKGRSVELKTYGPVTNHTNCNIGYTFPAPISGQTKEQYAELVRKEFATSDKFTGGHYWVAMDKSRSKVYAWHYQSQKEFADYCKTYVLSRMRKIPKKAGPVNFGRTRCKQCKTCHEFSEFETTFTHEAQKCP
jgi:hypothetical protein